MTEKPTGQPNGRRRMALPAGKIRAMHRDGWSMAAIARYFDVSSAAIKARLMDPVMDRSDKLPTTY